MARPRNPNPDNPNRQRDHQANERTFLAWLRTAVSLIAFGFAIARFGLFTNQLQAAITNELPTPHSVFNSENLGLILVVAGIVSMGLAAWRYNKVYWQIEQGDFRPDRQLIWVMTAVVMALGTLSIPLLVRRYPDPPQKSPASQLFKRD